jgi:acyl carrier protein
MNLQETVVEVIHSIIGKPEKLTREMITMDSSLVYDLDADSLDLFEMVIAFEKKLNLKVDEDQVKEKVDTVQDIVNLLEAELKEEAALDEPDRETVTN